MDESQRAGKMERARLERLEREERARTEEGQRRGKMAAAFEGLVRYRTREIDPNDDEIIHYGYVEVYQNFTREGPRPGERFRNVDLNADTGDLVFKLKSGGRRMLMLSPGKPPAFCGDFEPRTDQVEEDLDEDGQPIIPKGRRSRI